MNVSSSYLPELANQIGNSFTWAFGHPFLAGATLLIIFFAALHRSGVPPTASVVLSVVMLVGLAGVFLPHWILPFIAIALGVLLATGLARVFMGY